MSKKPEVQLATLTGDTSRRTVILSLAGATFAGLTIPKQAWAKSDNVQIQPVSANTVVVDMNNVDTSIQLI